MGIPKYYRYLVKKTPELVRDIDDDEIQADFLYLDLNCLIHPSVRKIMSNNPNLVITHNATIDLPEYKSNPNYQTELEKLMFQNLKNDMDFIINQVNPNKGIFIAIDGVAPRAKMEQQRKRRHKSHYDNLLRTDIYEQFKAPKPTYWDTNCISPGTIFMDKLVKEVNGYCENKKTSGKQIIFSSCYVPGEGEHKIMDYLRNRELVENETHMVYGLDADLIMLSLLQKHKIFLVREAIQFGKPNPDQLNLFDINLLKECIITEIETLVKSYTFERTEPIDPTQPIKEVEPIDRNKFILDYVILGFLLGNDFLPNIINLDINEGSIDNLLNIYAQIFGIRQKFMVDENNQINFNYFQAILSGIYFNEDEKLRDYQDHIFHKRVHLQPKETALDKELEKLNFFPIFFDKKNWVKLGYPHWHDRYYNYYFNIRSVHKNKDFLDRVCYDYIRGIQWVFSYYTQGIRDWTWFYPYHAAPLLRELVKYLNNRVYAEPFNVSPIYKPLEQLSIIFPKQSWNLLPREITDILREKLEYYYVDNFELDTMNKTMLWECEPYLPFLDSDKIVQELQKHTLTDTYATKRNVQLVNTIWN